jgi:tetratricopeptide (TPR) repeat protein
VRFFLLRVLATAIGLVGSVAAAELDREIVLAPHDGAEREDLEIRRWQGRVAANTASASDYERLAWAFVTKARTTLDAGYYKLAEKTADLMDARFGVSPASQLVRGHVLHNLHRFREAEEIARKLAQTRGQPEDFALWSDALMERGDLAGAIAACQQLANLRPGVEAYSRIAHLRWLKGDLPGATAAMEMAMQATGPRDAEGKAWTLSRLSGYYLQAGRAAAALNAAEAAIGHVSEYAPAWLAQGRALLALARGAEAIEALTHATKLNPLPEYQWWLADALHSAGREQEAATVESNLNRRGAASDPRTLALFLATRGERVDDAVRFARDELAMRADVQTHDACAWALAAKGDLTAAETEMQRALAEGTRDARLYLHAGEIAERAGRMADATRFFHSAREILATLTPSERARLATHAAVIASANFSPPSNP